MHFVNHVTDLIITQSYQQRLAAVLKDYVMGMIEGMKYLLLNTPQNELERLFNVVDTFRFRDLFIANNGVQRQDTLSRREKFMRDMAMRWSYVRNSVAHPAPGIQCTEHTFNILDFIAS